MRITDCSDTFHKHLFGCNSCDLKMKVSLNSKDWGSSSSFFHSVSHHFANFFHEQLKLRWSLQLWESILIMLYMCELKTFSMKILWKFRNCVGLAALTHDHRSCYEVFTSTNATLLSIDSNYMRPKMVW